jgi:hypothetical protein
MSLLIMIKTNVERYIQFFNITLLSIIFEIHRILFLEK